MKKIKFLSLILLIILCNCKDFSYFVFTIEFPETPLYWSLQLGVPEWRIEFISQNSGGQFIEVQNNEKIQVTLPIIDTFAVIAWPVYPEKKIFSGFLMPAGAIFPFDVKNDTLILTWEAGTDAVFFRELADFSVKESGKIPANFNWPKFRELFASNSISSDVCNDPWLVDWRSVAEKTISSSFDRRRLIPTPAEILQINVPPGVWYGSSPFQKPLIFLEGGTPSFPVREGLNVWFSEDCLLRINGSIWTITRW